MSVHRKEYSPLCSDFTERSDVLSQERAVFFYTSNMQLYSGPIIKRKPPYDGLSNSTFPFPPSALVIFSMGHLHN